MLTSSRSELVVVGGVADPGDVADQRVEPDIDHLGGVEGEREAPVREAPGDADVLQAALDEMEDLVASRLGDEEVGVPLEVFEEAVLEVAQTEEVVVLLHQLDRALVDAAEPRDQLLVG